MPSRPLSLPHSLPRVLTLLLVLWGAGACGGGDVDDGGARGPGMLGEPALFTTDDGFLTFTLPERWGTEVAIRESTPAELEWSPPAPERVFQFILTPRDSRFGAENLFNLYVYDRVVWEGAAAQAADIGEEVSRQDDVVYVVGRPPQNPFPSGSVDHGRFERFSMSLDEIREALPTG